MQAWDRYAYTSNNPVKYTDPSGHCLPNMCGYTHDYDESFSPVNELINWREYEDEATFTSDWFYDHSTYDPSKDELLTYVEDYIQTTGSSYYGITYADVQDIYRQYGLLRTSQTTSFRDMITSFFKTGAPSSSTIFCRYCSNSEVQAIKDTGLLRGGKPGANYFTTDIYNTASEAQQKLSLFRTPEVRVEFTIQNSPQINGPGIVEPSYGQPGGGTEYWSYDPIQVIIKLVSQLIH